LDSLIHSNNEEDTTVLFSGISMEENQCTLDDTKTDTNNTDSVVSNNIQTSTPSRMSMSAPPEFKEDHSEITAVIYSPLPKQGDVVLIDKLASTEDWSGGEGTVVCFNHDQNGYEVKIESQADTKCIRLTSLSVVEKRNTRLINRSYQKTHVLIPCHGTHTRRLDAFMHCIKSVASQQFPDDFDVFIGLSGSEEFRVEALKFISMVASKCVQSHWHVYDTGLSQRSQMEHFRYLLEDLSVPLDPSAMLMFLDSDDMFHPLRLIFFHQAKNAMGIPDDAPLPISCKLVFSSETMGPYQGRMENFISGPNDFFKWKRDSTLRRIIQLVPTSRCEDEDCEEYFDFMVPTHILQKFFWLNPPDITCHKYCDLRLLAVLKTVAPIEVRDSPAAPWLLAHYKASIKSMKTAFDNHGVFVSQSFDHLSTQIDKPSQQDIVLAATNRKLSPRQLRMRRLYVESILIQYLGWDEKKTAVMRRIESQHLNKLYGRGFGTTFVKEVEAELWKSLGKYTSTESNGAWKPLL